MRVRRAEPRTEPLVDRRTSECGFVGDHEACDGWHPMLDGTRSTARCNCTCHNVEPWPFEHDG